MASNTIAIVNMLELLTKRPVSVKQIQEITGLADNTIYNRYFKMLKPRRLIRIAGWERNEIYHWVALWEWNQSGLPDVPKPPPMTPKERERRRVAKRKKLAEEQAPKIHRVELGKVVEVVDTGKLAVDVVAPSSKYRKYKTK